MGKKIFYLCENEYGDDPCDWAVEGRKIPDSEVTMPSIGNPKCPGFTRSGKECGKELIPIASQRGGGNFRKMIPLIGGGLALVLILALIFWGIKGCEPRSLPTIELETTTLVFPKTESGEAQTSFRIQNIGKGELIVTSIETTPPTFSCPEKELRVAPQSGETLIVEFKSTETKMAEGQLTLHTNAQEQPLTIRLIANQDPWWVYKKLETSSKTLSTE